MANHINIFLCFARSGGTVLNQCLGCLPNVVIMSEVNPLGGGWGKKGKDSPTTIQAQAKEWYNIELQNSSFANSAIELASKCEYLIIRDWSFVNFNPDRSNNNNPSYSFLTIDQLSTKIPLHIFSFVRNAIDVCLSRGGDFDTFANSYLRYAQQLQKLGIKLFHYEDFCVAPEFIIEAICKYCEIPYVSVTRLYCHFDTVSGDVQTKSRGQAYNHIVKLPRKQASPDVMKRIMESNRINQANKILGY